MAWRIGWKEIFPYKSKVNLMHKGNRSNWMLDFNIKQQNSKAYPTVKRKSFPVKVFHYSIFLHFCFNSLLCFAYLSLHLCFYSGIINNQSQIFQALEEFYSQYLNLFRTDSIESILNKNQRNLRFILMLNLIKIV